MGQGWSATHPQNQLLGGRGHEHAVTPGGAPGVHVLLALAGVLAVRVAGETGHGQVSTRHWPLLHVPPTAAGVLRSLLVLPALSERIPVHKFLEYRVKLTVPLKK